MSSLDPVTFEVLWHKLMQLAEEMGLAYFRTTASHVVITGTDASSAIMTPEGEAVTVGPYIVTQANVLPLIVRSTIEQCSENPGIGPGDVFLCNDPYAGAIHQPDIASVAPFFWEGELVAWVGTSGHQVDNGGMDPGGFPVGATEVHQEGLRIPPTKIVEAGRARDDLIRWIDNQVRDPLVALDVRAQIATVTVGIRRLHELCERYGVDGVRSTMQGILDHSEQRFAEKLAELPDGTWSQTQYIDHDGHEPNIYRIRCELRKHGDRLVVDFTGSSENARGIINATYAGLSAAVLSSAYINLAHDLPWNSGVRRRIDILSSPGTVNNAAYPAPCTMATISATIVTIDAVWLCMAQMLLEGDRAVEAMANWSGSSMAPIFAGITRDGEPFAHTEMSHFGGGGGARTYRDGVDTAGIVFNTTPNIPNIEVNEQDFPVLYLMRRHLIDSGGPGTFRGGLSAELAYIAHKAPAPMESLFAGTGCYMPNAMGLRGGLPGAAVRVMRVRDSDVRQRLKRGERLPATLEEAGGMLEMLEPKHPRSPFGDDDIWYHSWQAGGGYGDPLLRDPDLVARDVRERAVSADAARDIYGVVLGDGGAVDASGTVARRGELRRERLAGDRSLAAIAGGAPAEGSLRPLGGAVGTDANGVLACLHCGEHLGVLDGRARLTEARELIGDLDDAGPGRGQDYGDHGFRLRRLCCPGCGTLLLSELVYHGGRLAPIVETPASVVA
jgi:N-methylhydantoinase B